MPAVRGCSSAGLSASEQHIRIPRLKVSRRAGETPWRPRAGRGSIERLGSPVPFFSPRRSVRPVGPGGYGPKGPPPRSNKEQPAVRARGDATGVSVDAIERSESAEAQAAIERRQTAALGVEAARTLLRAEEAFAAVLGPPSAGRLRHLPAIRGLLWALARLDRYADQGRGRAGAGLDVLERELAGILDAGEEPPRHLGYFIPALQAEGRRWKHTWAPRVKAERRSRGVSPAHRAERSYRRWLQTPLSYDFRRRQQASPAASGRREDAPSGGGGGHPEEDQP